MTDTDSMADNDSMTDSDSDDNCENHGKSGLMQPEQCFTPEKEKGHSEFVKEWFPICDDVFKPKIGMTFDNLNDGGEFYKKYASQTGFSVRKYSSKKDKNRVDIYKRFVCYKQGYKAPTAKGKEKAGKRKTKLTREGCNAFVAFRRTVEGRYEIYRFTESHTHVLSTPTKRHMLKSNREVTSVHRSFLKSCNQANIGASKAYRLMKEQVGSFGNIGCGKQDLKNFQRDLKTYIKDSDADMFIQNLRRKQEVNPSFYFDYDIDGENHLQRVFWADGICRKNYALYGDVVTFDTTYDTNRYKMIFAPFTGMDNHRLCVSFGAAFLADEKAESFVWLFGKFLDAMGGHKPNCIITDQDPAMKSAIQRVFDSSVHRFCIWHIMRKVSEKVGHVLNCDDRFNSMFKSCVYNSEDPAEFEEAWESVIVDFNLEDNSWLTQMYDIRNMWIPAYFRDIFLGALMRTTSMSESENSFFSNFSNPHLNLVEFWMRYESAIEVQRNKQSIEDNVCFTSMPQLKTNKDMEKHASEIYTFPNFYKFQEELWVACMSCEIEERISTDECQVIKVADMSHKNSKTRDVSYNPLDHVAHCSCQMFTCEGIPCRHILCVLKGKLREVPNFYVLNRWTKMAASKPMFDVDGNVLQGTSQMQTEDQKVSSIWMKFLDCMRVAGRDVDQLNVISNGIDDISAQLNGKSKVVEGRIHELESFIGARAPEEVEILPPKQSNTKGSGSGGGKRLKGGKEISMEKQAKIPRLCRNCGKKGYHDSRNCPEPPSSSL